MAENTPYTALSTQGRRTHTSASPTASGRLRAVEKAIRPSVQGRRLRITVLTGCL